MKKKPGKPPQERAQQIQQLRDKLRSISEGHAAKFDNLRK